MRHKRIAAAEARNAAKTEASASRALAAAQPSARTSGLTEDRDVIPWLRQLGFSAAEARRGAERCAGNPDASLEQRVRLALSCIGVRGTRIGPTGDRGAATPAGAVNGGDAS